MARTVGDFLVERLRAWGAHRIFGYPADGINGIVGALNRAGGDPAFVQAGVLTPFQAGLDGLLLPAARR